MIPFYGQKRVALVELLSSFFGKAKAQLRADTIFRNIYKHKKSQVDHFIELSQDVKNWFDAQFSLDLPLEIAEYQCSSHDGSVKFVMRLKRDGKLIESVLIPERGRLTQCLSTQVGCEQGCRFCQTGRMGLQRSLTSDEIVAQVLLAERWRSENFANDLSSYPRVTNIVYMGMGEPLDNIDNMLESTTIFCDPLALNFSPNKVTISTVGLLPQLQKVLNYSKVALALSLHSPFDEERSKIMPVNLKSPITEVISVLKDFSQKFPKRKFMIQYTLLRGINDTTAHAQALIALLTGISVKINLIPLNEHTGASFRRPDLGRVYAFQTELKKAGMVATVRLSKGRDIQAACGQLIKDKMAKE